MDRLDTITAEYGVRNSRNQKRDFLDYAMGEFEKMGYETAINRGYTLGIQSDNLVAGSIYRASTVFLVYYDTPKTNFMPHIKLPLNRAMGVFLSAIPYIALVVVMHFICRTLPFTSEFLLDACLVIMLGMLVDKKENMSVNASLALAFELAESAGGAAFVFLDNGSFFKLGRGVLLNTYGNAFDGKTVVIIDGASLGNAVAALSWGNVGKISCENVIQKSKAQAKPFKNGILLAPCNKGKYLCVAPPKRDSIFTENAYIHMRDCASEFIPNRRNRGSF